MVVALIPAAGRGERLGSRTVPKQFLPLAGVPVLVHTLRRVQSVPEIDAIVVAVPEAYRDYVRQLCREYALEKVCRIVSGGVQRQDSVACTLQTEEAAAADYLLVHDAVRPFTPPELFQRVLEAARLYGAAVPGLPPTETLKRIAPDGAVVQTVVREQFRFIQTPQAFRRELLQRAYAFAQEHHLSATDDAALVEALGHPVYVVEGVRENIKLTYPADFLLAECLLSQQQGSR
jgi:2-C-methyl-D-erythritol 4-phosphate cytidylyltransferase